MIIGITGPAGAGKDTVADYLVQAHDFRKLSWASPLKAMLAAAGLPEPANRDDKEKQIPGFDFSWRQAAQRLGTEWGRGLDADIWIKMVGQILREQPHVEWVISDCRFENETALIRSLGGQILHLEGRSVDLGAAAGHASEAGLTQLPEDWLLYNNGTISEMYSEVGIVLLGMRRQKIVGSR